MKIYFLSLFSILLTFTSAQAQTDFAPIGAEWYYGSTSINYIHYNRYWSEKDTVIDGLQCRKISGVYVPKKGDSSATEPVFVYSSGDTVLYYNTAFSKFTPIFIFNTKAGDTLSFNNPHYYVADDDTNAVIQVIVEKVDTLTVDGIDLRRVWLQPYIDGGKWAVAMVSPYTERIGSGFEFLPFRVMAGIPEAVEKAFRCYKDQEINYQLREHCDDLSSWYDGIEEQEDNIGKIQVFPNPFNRTFTIRMNRAEPKAVHISVTDIAGGKVAGTIIPPNQKELLWPLGLPEGIYILKCNVNGTVYTQKLIVKP